MYSDGKTTARAIGGVVGFILIVFLLFASFQRVEANQACVVKHWGKIANVEDAGTKFTVPFRDTYDCQTIAPRTYETVSDSDGDGNLDVSNANYVDYEIQNKTLDGINAWHNVTVKYRVPYENLMQVYKNNARSDDQVLNNIVKFHVRSIVPQELNKYNADQLYFGQLQAVSQTIRARIEPVLKAEGVEIIYFEVRRGRFDPDYEAAIRLKAQKSEQIKAKIQDQELAKQEAERVRIEAEGVAAKQKIDATRDAENAIIAADAAAEIQVIQAKAAADQVKIAADAEAQAISVRGAALAANPLVLEWHRIDIIATANVIYLPSDSGVLPIINVDNNKQ